MYILLTCLITYFGLNCLCFRFYVFRMSANQTNVVNDYDLLLDDLDYEGETEYAVVVTDDGEPVLANRSLDDESPTSPSPSTTFGSYDGVNVMDDHSLDPDCYKYPDFQQYNLPTILQPPVKTNKTNNAMSSSSTAPSFKEVDTQPQLSVHQPLTPRVTVGYKPYNNMYRDNNGQLTTDFGSRIVPGYSDRCAGSFNNDVRSTSTMVFGSNTAPPRGPVLHDLPEEPYTLSASVSKDGFDCNCRDNNIDHKIKADRPLLLVFGDNFVPPVLGGNGRCAIVIRVDRATPETILLAAKNYFDATGDAAFSIPAGSMIVISLTSYLLEVKAAVYISAVDALKRSLAKLLYTRSATMCNESNSVLDCNIMSMDYKFVDVVAPHSNVDIQAAIAAATVVHVATVVAGAIDDQLLGTIPHAYNEYMDDNPSTVTYAEIPPYIVLNSLSGNVARHTVSTAATRVLAYEGLYDGMTHEHLVLFWSLVVDRIRAYMAEKRLQAANIPSCSDIKLGACSPLLSNLGIKDAFPIIHKWMVDRMPLPCKIKPY